MKRIRRAYSKTVSLIDETAVQIYGSFVGKRRGFLLESYDKNNGRYVFMMIDWGCTTTSICCGANPNNHLASMTSNPLFIREAESIVTLAPIFQFGCFKAAAGVTDCK